MPLCFTLRVLDQIRVNGFDVEVEETDDHAVVEITQPGAGDGERFEFDANSEDSVLRRLADAFCTPPQVAKLFAGRGLASA